MRGQALLPSILLSLALASSCSEPADDANRFSVALLLPGPENDEGWNQAAYEGLAKIRDSLGADTRKVQARTATEIEQAMSHACEEGYDLVIGHGNEFNAPAVKLAAAYPEVAFITTGGTETADNLATVILRLEEAAYQLGILAAHLSESGTLSAISGERYEPVKRVVDGFREGARSVNPDIVVLEDYLGDWEDVTKAKEMAFAHAEAGADVFFQNADAAGAGVFEAARSLGKLAFGCNRDQSSKAPDVIVASAVADISGTLAALAREVKDGTFRGGVRSFGTQEGKVRMVVNPKLASRVPAGVLTQCRNAEAKLKNSIPAQRGGGR